MNEFELGMMVGAIIVLALVGLERFIVLGILNSDEWEEEHEEE